MINLEIYITTQSCQGIKPDSTNTLCVVECDERGYTATDPTATLPAYLIFSCDWVKFRIAFLYFPHVVAGITNYTIGMTTYRVYNVTCKI